MAGTLDPHYDFALLGTSLPLSILSAALSRAGYSVLHIDENDHYGGPWSSLTLLELIEWSSNTALHQSQGRFDVSITFPAFASSTKEEKDVPPPELAALNRHFSISLAPTIVPCAGPTIDVLIRSKVASYCTFRLLQKTSVYSATSAENWPLRKVPSSKEDIFKDKTLSLIDKRRLMKLLQQAVPDQDSTAEGESSASAASTSGGTFFDYLLSKEGANLSPELAKSVAYGVALCSSQQDSTASAMERIRRHITGIGRYGNAAYLVGQYGGAGEMAQCFCRASAVQGGTFVLGHRVEKCSQEEVSFDWSISLEGIEGATTVEHVVGDSDVLEKVLPDNTNKEGSDTRSTLSISGILLLDRGIPFEDPNVQVGGDGTTLPPETGLVIFPPSNDSSIGAVSALQMAEGTFSCPKGMYLIYLSAAVMEGHVGKIDAVKELEYARDEIVRLASMSKREWTLKGDATELETESNTVPLMEVYYTTSEQNAEELHNGTNIWSAQSSTTSVATSLDEATLQAENIFWEIIGNNKRGDAELARRKRKPAGYSVGQGLGGVVDGVQSETFIDFFPSEDRGDDDDDY